VCGIILVHNHPSGNLRPSSEDDKLTKQIKEGGKLLDVRVLDHLIIAPTGYYSYADEGRM
jgi:DNA repair protein RadC